MSGIVTAHWRIASDTPPRPLRHCSTCGQTRPFHSSGKIRLNANGRRLDAWLIYKCTTCDRTWTLPVIERVPVAALPAAELDALQQSDPDLVRQVEGDMALLARHCDRVTPASGITIHKTLAGPWVENWTTLQLQIDVQTPGGVRLDRVLAQGLGLSRSTVQASAAKGALVIAPPFKGRLAAQVLRSQSVQIFAMHLTEAQRATIAAALRGD